MGQCVCGEGRRKEDGTKISVEIMGNLEVGEIAHKFRHVVWPEGKKLITSKLLPNTNAYPLPNKLPTANM